jgi:hypothetical protein
LPVDELVLDKFAYFLIRTVGGPYQNVIKFELKNLPPFL